MSATEVHSPSQLILAGTGPEGGRGFHAWSQEITSHAYKDVPGAEDVFYLFFAPTETSQAKAREFVERIFTRERDRDQKPALAVRDEQAEAITAWGIPDMSKLARLTGITQPTLVANGSSDILVPTVNSYLLAGHIPNAQLIIYPDASTVASHPEQGWSLLCNGVIVFDDMGEILPGGRVIPPHTPAYVRLPVAA